MPFNESPGAPAIDWLEVKVIITSFHVSRHAVDGFMGPADTYIFCDLSAHLPKVSNLNVWLRMDSKTILTPPLKQTNKQQQQTPTPKTQRGPTTLWRRAAALTFTDQLLPDGAANRVTPNQHWAGDINVKGFSLLTRRPTTIEHLSLATCGLKHI